MLKMRNIVKVSVDLSILLKRISFLYFRLVVRVQGVSLVRTRESDSNYICLLLLSEGWWYSLYSHISPDLYTNQSCLLSYDRYKPENVVICVVVNPSICP